MFNRLRAILRLAHFALHSFVYLIIVYFLTLIGGKDKEERGLRVRKRWARGMNRILAFRVTWEGEPPVDETCLYVGNHRSSLDPLVVMAKIIAYPISRADVRHWPIVGKGSDMTGIIFVDKESRASRKRTKELLLEALQSGRSILIFPEGRTNVKPTTATFQKGSFEQAAKGGFKVIPFVIEYKEKEDYWDHTDNFAMHFIKRFGKRRTMIHIAFGPPLESDNSWTLLRGAQTWIDNKIVEVRARWEGDGRDGRDGRDG